MSRRSFPVVLLALVAALAAGCTSKTQGSPQTTTGDTAEMTTTGAPSSSDAADGNAPRVPKPLDATTAIQHTCSALTATDIAALGISGATSTPGDEGTIGKGCTWTSSDANVGVAISWELTDTHGLSDLYSIKSEQKYWTEMTVSGYPAVEASSVDERPDGRCSLNVGVRDTLFFVASFTDSTSAGQACGLAKQAAAAVIKNLGGN